MPTVEKNGKKHILVTPWNLSQAINEIVNEIENDVEVEVSDGD